MDIQRLQAEETPLSIEFRGNLVQNIKIFGRHSPQSRKLKEVGG